jgi:AcrR family transcriptional regulator
MGPIDEHGDGGEDGSRFTAMPGGKRGSIGAAVDHGRVKLTPRGAAKRERILEAAAELLARHGYGGTTLADIAHAAGTQSGSLYHHFESREQLAREVLLNGAEAAMAHTSAVVDALPANASPRRRLEAAITAHVEYILDRNPAALAGARAVGQLPPAVNEPLEVVWRAYGRYFASLFDAAVADGSIDPSVDVAAARMLVVGAANWTAEWFDPNGTSSAGDIGRLLCRLVFEGLGPSRRRRAR